MGRGRQHKETYLSQHCRKMYYQLQTPVPNSQWIVSRWSEHDSKEYSPLPLETETW